MRTYTLTTPATVTVQPANVATVSSISIREVIDNGQSVVARIMVNNNVMILTLWDDTTTPNYTAIGNWTDENVNARIATLLGIS